MRQLSFALLVLPLALSLTPLAGQAPPTPHQPHLVLSAFLGYRGGRSLWTLNGQPMVVLDRVGNNLDSVSSQHDTLDLIRRVTPGFIAGLTAIYYPSSHLGFTGEIAFLDLSMDSRCGIRRFDASDTADVNPALCASLNGQSVTTSAVGFTVGAIARAAPDGPTSPYVSLGLGLVSRVRGTVAMTGVLVDTAGAIFPVDVVSGSNESKVGLGLQAAVGVALAVAPGYELRIEGRDIYTPLARVTGPDPNVNDLPLAPPHASHYDHHLAFVVGLGIVLEQKRGRRY